MRESSLWQPAAGKTGCSRVRGPVTMGAMVTPRVRWSGAVGEAAWIRPLLEPFERAAVTSVVPRGFEAYARVLHPLSADEEGDDSAGGKPTGREHCAGKETEAAGCEAAPVRWREVAAWSGAALTPRAQFHDIALPEHTPPGPAPWDGSGPEEGTLSEPDATALVEILRAYTGTPEECWFCLWDGHGWDTAVTSDGCAVTDPVPAAVRAGPRVELPHREYLLYAGRVEEALAFVPEQRQTANLWWPRDRSWCVATEIDLQWTYVAGSRTLIDHLVADPRLEAQPVEPSDSHLLEVHGWLARARDRAVTGVLATGATTVTTSRGTVTARLRRPSLLRRGVLSIETTHFGEGEGESAGEGEGAGEDSRKTYLQRGRGTVDRDEIGTALTFALTDLANG